LRAAFWCLLWIVLRLPIPVYPMLRLSRANLRQRKTQGSLTVMALSAGAFSVTFAVLAMVNAQSTVSEMRGSDAGYNLMVFTTAEDARDTVNHMILQGAEDTYISERVTGTANGEEMLIEGRDAGDIHKDIRYDGPLPISGDAALLPEYERNRFAAGDVLTLAVNGEERAVTLTGFYDIEQSNMSAWSAPMIVSRSILQPLSDGQGQIRVIGTFPVSVLREATDALGQTL